MASYISVFIPTYNGVDNIAKCIDVVLAQKLPPKYRLELIVIDSGSKDGTVDVLKKYGDRVNLIEIPNTEFSHGGTRQKAAEIAKGEFILFLTQDATPRSHYWLINMIEPFSVSDKVGCVFGRQVPRPNAPATIKREVLTAFGGLGSPDSIVIHRNKSLVDRHETNVLNSFFSDVNSAVRRDLLMGDIPFRKINYAEDQRLAEDMQAKGYLKAYSPQGEVIHSNDYSSREYFKRKFDEFVGLNKSIGYPLTASKKSLLLGWIRPTVADWRFIRRDGEYSFKSKILWSLESPLYNFASKAGLYFAAKSLTNPRLSNKHSLENKTRR